MRIVVFVRPVQNPAVPVEPGSAQGLEGLPGYAPIPNPMDELALETALRLREEAGWPVSLIVCSVGGEASKKVLHEFLACGADRAVVIEESRWEPDPAVVAARLRDFFRSEPADLCLFGLRDLDTAAGAVGPMFTALTGMPYIDSVVQATWNGERQVEVIRKQKRLRERIRVPLPGCLGILRGAPLRYPSFWGKLQAGPSCIRSIPHGEVSCEPRLERKKFTRSKPKRGSVAGAYAESRSVDQMRQALGIAGPQGKQEEDSFLKGDPEDVAERILTTLKKEKLIDTNST
jgi:electron transfer flavoprotein beta subunit